ncbi:hypothetical protein CEXT_447441 [Caerostris extrusa]|uniref:HNH homing endonuclease n=1 Tax=Caerostris extrusa TaxID=172846 RepID=A0AAV4VY57_CAEEX|nr:hypothetical protein CEXT_447441 [Caerostris extrusa]
MRPVFEQQIMNSLVADKRKIKKANTKDNPLAGTHQDTNINCCGLLKAQGQRIPLNVKQFRLQAEVHRQASLCLCFRCHRNVKNFNKTFHPSGFKYLITLRKEFSSKRA